MARRYTKVRELRSSEQNVLLLDAGDQYQGTLWFVYYQGRAAQHFMGRMGYDVMVGRMFFLYHFRPVGRCTSNRIEPIQIGSLPVSAREQCKANCILCRCYGANPVCYFTNPWCCFTNPWCYSTNPWCYSTNPKPIY